MKYKKFPYMVINRKMIAAAIAAVTLGFGNSDNYISNAAFSAEYQTLKEAISDTASPRTYTLNDNENVNANLGTMGGNSGAELTIIGNSIYSISGNGKTGITVNSGKILNIDNVGSLNSDNTVNAAWQGFSGQLFKNDAGTINFKGKNVIANNSGTGTTNLITNSNNGTINVSDSLSIIGNSYASSLLSNTDSTISDINVFIRDNNENSTTSNTNGLIYNSANSEKNASIGIISGSVINNTIKNSSGGIYGGLLRNISKNYAQIDGINAEIANNQITSVGSLFGGLIRNEASGGVVKIGDISGSIHDNNFSSADAVYGIILCNKANGKDAEVGNITSEIINNKYTAPNNKDLIGLISNEGNTNGKATIAGISGQFLNNEIVSDKRTVKGGLIYNYAKTAASEIGNISSNIVSNTMNTNAANGGLIFNGTDCSSNSNIGIISGEISDNNIITGNGIVNGGLVYNVSSSSGKSEIKGIASNIINNNLSSNGTVNGGIIFNSGSKSIIDYISGNITENTVIANGKITGGVINNSTQIDYISGDIKNNYIESTNNAIDGGVLYNNTNAVSKITSVIENNYSKVSNVSESAGGIINNLGTLTLSDNSVKNNATNLLSSISNSGTLNIFANEKDVLFSGNKINVTVVHDETTGTVSVSGGEYVDINNTGILNISANSDKTVIFNGAIDGTSGNNSIKINNDSEIKSGTYIFNNDVTAKNLQIYNGANIKLGSHEQEDGTTSYGTLNLTNFSNDTNGGIIDFQNNYIDEQNFGNLTLNSNLDIKFDVDLANEISDTFIADSVSGSGKLNITSVNLLSDSQTRVSTKISNDVLKDAINLSIQNASSADRSYVLLYDNSKVDGGYLVFDNTGAYNLVTVSRSGESQRVYNMNANESIATDIAIIGDSSSSIGTMGAGTLTIDGNSENKYGIKGDGKGGITVNSGSKLILKNIGEATIDTDTGEYTYSRGFEGFNKSQNSGGGVVYNKGELSVEDVVFYKNNAGNQYGSAIYNEGKITNIIGKFISNSKGTGTIYNYGSNGVIDYIEADFVRNSTEIHGGAITNNHGGRISKIVNSHFILNTAKKSGGAIRNLEGTGNYANIDNSLFKNNSARQGGAIHNGKNSTVIVNNVLFDENYSVKSLSSGVSGGSAIYNEGNLEISDSAFKNNASDSKGGAIYSDIGNIEIFAKSDDVLFTNNKDNATLTKLSSGTYSVTGGEYNDFYGNGETNISLSANTNRSITFNGSIVGSSTDLNINADSDIKGGTYNFNNNLSVRNLSVYNGADIKLASYQQEDDSTSYGTLSVANFSNDANGGTIDFQNSHIDEHSFGNIVLNSDLDIKIDVSLEDAESDYYTAESYSGTGLLNISSIKILSDSSTDVTTKVCNSVLRDAIKLSVESVDGAIHSYTVLYDGTKDDGGYLTFSDSDVVNLVKTNRATASQRLYSLLENENIVDDIAAIGDSSTSIGTMGGENSTLTINGNKNSVNGGSTNANSISGITILAGQTLNINEVGDTTNTTSLKNGFYGFKGDDGDNVLNNSGNLNIASSVFANNKHKDSSQSSAYGSVIYNSLGAVLNIEDSLFINNSNDSNGKGTIANYGNAQISNSKFISNFANQSAGVIYNGSTGKLIIGNGDSGAVTYFTGNNSAKGSGAILNNGYLLIDEKNIFENNNESGNKSNPILTSDGGYTAISAKTEFINNQSGAIHKKNNFLTIEKQAIFKDNTKNGDGAAIKNEWGDTTVFDSSFEGNTSTNGNGGAIYNHTGSNLNLVANEENVVFSDNTASNKANDVHNLGALNLNATSGKNITFGGDITGTGTINVGRSDITYNSLIKDDTNFIVQTTNNAINQLGGDYIFNGNVTNKNFKIFNGATITAGEDGKGGVFTISDGFTNDANGGKFDMKNSVIQAMNFGKLSLSSALELELDVDAVNKIADTIEVADNSSGKFVITDIGYLSDIKNFEGKIQIIKNANSNTVLEFGEGFDNTFTVESTITGGDSITSSTVNWNDETGQWTQTKTDELELNIVGSDASNTLKDSIEYVVTGTQYGEKEYTTSGDILNAINTYVTSDTRNFNFSENPQVVEEYIASMDTGITSTGTLKINGSSTDKSVINYGGTYNGFSLTDTSAKTTVEISNTTITGAKDYIAVISSGNELILNNTNIDENTGDIKNAGTLTLKNDNTINNDITGTGSTTVESGTTTLGANITQKSLNIDSGAELECNNAVITITDKIVNNGEMTAKANNLIVGDKIENNNILNLAGGENANKITGTNGVINYTAAGSNIADIVQKTVNLNADFENSGNITANVINNVSLVNTSNGEISYVKNNDAELNNSGKITYLEVDKGTVDSTGTITTLDFVSGDVTNKGSITTASMTSGTLSNEENAAIGTLTVDSGTVTNAGNITGTVTNAGSIDNTGIISGIINNKADGSIITNASNLINSINNAGEIIFNGGSTQSVINGYNSSTDGVIKIQGNVSITNAINDNIISLDTTSSGAAGLASIGSINDLSDATKIYANGGNLTIKDNAVKNHNLGNVDLTDNNISLSLDVKLNEAVDSSNLANKKADKISGTVTGSNSILINELNIIADANDQIPAYAVVADDNIKSNTDLGTNVRTGVTGKTDSFMITYITDNDGGATTSAGGKLKFEFVDLVGAVRSMTKTKVYVMGHDETVTEDLSPFNGTALSINGGNEYSIIAGTTDTGAVPAGITVGGTQVLSLNEVKEVSGFETAITNNEGVVNITDTVFTGNTTDIDNNGTLNLYGTDVIDKITNSGTSNGSTVVQAYSKTDNDGNPVTVYADVTVNNSLVQDNVEVKEGNKLTIKKDFDSKLTNAGTVDNQGNMIINGGSNTGEISSSDNKGTLEIKGDYTNTGSITEKTVTVSSGTLTNDKTDDATGSIIAEIINNSSVKNDGEITAKGGSNGSTDTSSITGTGTFTVDGVFTNNSKGTITQGSVVVNEAQKLVNAGEITAELTLDSNANVENSNKITANGGENIGTIKSTGDNSQFIIADDYTNKGEIQEKTITVNDGKKLLNDGGDAEIVTDNLNIGEGSAVENENKLTVNNSVDNKGTISNTVENSEINFKGEDMTIGGTLSNVKDADINIDGTGTTTLSANTTNNGNLNIKSDTEITNAVKGTGVTTNTADKLSIKAAIEQETFTNTSGEVSVDNTLGSIKTTGNIINDGTLISNAENLLVGEGKEIQNSNDLQLTGGNNSNKITGSNGTTTFSGSSTNTADITQKEVKITDTGNVINNGATITADLTNDGTFKNDGVVNGKTENNNILTNNGELNGDVANSENGNLTNNSAISSSVNNKGILTNSNSGAMSGGLDNTGVVNNTGVISGTVNNEKVVNPETAEETNGVINTTVAGLTGNITNNAIINYTDGGSTVADVKGNGIINLNGSDTVTLNNNINGNTLSLNNGTLIFGLNKDISQGGMIANGGAISGVVDGILSEYKLGNVEIRQNTKISGIDFDLNSLQSDKFIGDFSGDGVLDIGDVKVQGLPAKNSIKVKLSDTTGISENNLKVKNQKLPDVMTPIRKMSGRIQDNTLIYQGKSGSYGDFNPSIMASSIATQVGGYLNQLETLQDGFYHMDRYMKYSHQQRYIAENAGKFASADDSFTVAPKPELPLTSEAMWTKPYATFENVQLKHGPTVNNFAYGALYGGDSNLKDLGSGWKGIVSAFIGYNGNHMSYDKVSIDMAGGTAGVTGTLYKGNFFTGLTVSAGASSAEASTYFGDDHFNMVTAGIANKTGYNFEVNGGKLIVQPSIFTGYVMVNTLDYRNSANVRINSDTLNAVQIVPGLKIIGNLENGWQPYAAVDMVWNFIDNNKVMANDAQLPRLSVKPFVEYGVGVQKSWSERFTAYFQTMLRNGGRNGVSMTAGFRWALGRKHKTVKSKAEIKGTKKVQTNPDVTEPDIKNSGTATVKLQKTKNSKKTQVKPVKGTLKETNNGNYSYVVEVFQNQSTDINN